MKWFRMWTDILDDPKMNYLSAEDERRFIRLLAICAEEENEGKLQGKIDDIAWRIRVKPAALKTTFEKLCKLNILKLNGNGYEVIHWGKRQYRSDDVTERVKKHRMKRFSNVSGNVPCNNIETPRARTETETETEIKEGTQETPPASVLPLHEKPKKTAGHFTGQVLENLIPQIEDVCKNLNGKHNGFNPYQAVQKFLREKHHPGAILEALKAILKAKEIKAGPYPLMVSVLKVQDGNFRYSDAVKDGNQVQAAWERIAMQVLKSSPLKTIDGCSNDQPWTDDRTEARRRQLREQAKKIIGG